MSAPASSFMTKQFSMQTEEAPAGELDEVVRCSCGASSAQQSASDFSGLWLQCDRCKCWQHGPCVGHPDKAPKGKHMLQAHVQSFHIRASFLVTL